MAEGRESAFGGVEVDYSRAAAELLRAIRGKRSQVRFARRLGYAGNPITDWENQRRRPTASETFRAAELSNVDVAGALRRFHAGPGPSKVAQRWQLAPWLSTLRGSAPMRELTERSGRSRYTVSRWLHGETEPKLDEFLHFLDALTGRAHDLVGYLVPIDQVPSMQERHVQACAARAAALAAPWTELLLCVLETERYQEAATGGAKPLAETLGIEPGEVERCLVALTQAGVVEKRGGHYKVIGSLRVDACGALSQLQRHCLEVAQSRAGHRDDWFAYNAISVSAEDLESIHAKLKQTYREIRGMVAKSAPSQRAALLMMNLMRFDTPSEGE